MAHARTVKDPKETDCSGLALDVLELQQQNITQVKVSGAVVVEHSPLLITGVVDLNIGSEIHSHLRRRNPPCPRAFLSGLSNQN